MTAHRPVRRHWLQAKTLNKMLLLRAATVKFYFMFYFICGRSFTVQGRDM